MHLILKIGISRNTECVNTVGFPKLGHIYMYETLTSLRLHKDNLCLDLSMKPLIYKVNKKFEPCYTIAHMHT